jgi:hypothetical protein
MIGFWIIASLILPAAAQELTPQQRAMARRAAEIDAYRKLAETISGFQISSQTTVKDFVTESDQIQAGFSTFIRGIRIVGDPVYNPDGTVEVTAATTLAEVTRELKRIHRSFYDGTTVQESDLDRIGEYVRERVVTATGYGAPPPPPVMHGNPEFTGKNEPAPAEEPERDVNRPRWIYKPAPTAGMAGWEGVTGQGRLAAVRAARADAIRKLTETIAGVQISSQTRVRDFVTESDEIKAQVEAFIQGVKTIGEPEYLPDGTVQVHLGVTLAELVRQIQEVVKRHDLGGGRYQDITYKKVSEFTRKKLIEASGFGAPPQELILRGSRFIGWDALRGPMARATLMAREAAYKDAQRNFAERTAGLEVLAGTYVKDMVAESDVIMLRMRDHLKGVRPYGDYILYSDGVIEARAGATWLQIIKEVKQMGGTLPPDQTLEAIRIFEKRNFFFETGYGTIPSTAQFYVNAPLPPNPPLSPQSESWEGRKLRATGYGAPREGTSGPQGKLLAQRAARLDAGRKLIEQLYGLKIKGETTVRDFVTESDVIESEVAAFLRGAEEAEVRENPDGTWEVTLEIDLGAVQRILMPHAQ